MKSIDVAILIYGDIHSGRNALTEEKYKDLASSLSSEGCTVQSVLYHDDKADILRTELLQFDVVLTWVNPIEQGKDRKKLDLLLTEISEKGCFVSAHPEVIIKMGTKDILYKTKDMDWGGDTKLYTDYDDFVNRFPDTLQKSKIRILKIYRGNGGNGVFKILHKSNGHIALVHAAAGNEERLMSMHEFNNEFKPYFLNNGLLIDQEWNNNITNGMVRCYLSGSRVAGFGYQEINAFYTLQKDSTEIHIPPSKRYYFTENCGLFSDLKEIMEGSWVPQLQNNLSITDDQMPVIWDADFFINKINHPTAVGKYILCEINVSCVSPFPPSAIQFMVEGVRRVIKK